MKNKYLMAFSLLIGLTGRLDSLELNISGTGGFAAQYVFDNSRFLDSLRQIDFNIDVLTSLNTASYSLLADIRTGLDINRKEWNIELHKLHFAFTPFAFFSLNLGRLAYNPGKQTLLSNINYFSRYNYGNLLMGIDNFSGNLLLPNDVIQTVFTLPHLYFTLTCAPIPNSFDLIDPQAALFPKKDFPDEIKLGPPINQYLVLRNLYYKELGAIEYTFRNTSFALEWGGRFRLFEFALLFYHGWENMPLFTIEAEFPNGLFEYYDLALKPVYSLKDSLGLNQLLLLKDFTILADISFTFTKNFLTDAISASNFETLTVSSPYLEYTFGVHYRLPEIELALAAELKHYTLFNPDERIIHSLTDSLFIVYGQYSLPQKHLIVSLGCLGTFYNEFSMLIIVQLQSFLTEEIELSLSVPLIVGDEFSTFGQFRKNFLMFLSLRYHVKAQLKT